MALTRRLAFVVTEDWYFWSHRLALAKAAMDAGFEVTVVTRPAKHAERIRAAGLKLEDWSISRSQIGPWNEARAVLRLARIFRRIRPHIVHNVAIKPVVYGSAAAHLCGASKPAVVNALAGLGFVFASRSAKARLLRPALRCLLRVLLRRNGVYTICQNPEDMAALHGFGVAPGTMRLVRGAGVDLAAFRPSAEPAGPIVATMVSRMLRNKGAVELVEAGRILRARGAAVRIQLVGPPDPGNPASLRSEELEAWTREGLVEWLGPREDIAAIWASSHIAVLPSTYGEGLPKSLLEAAACARPIVATDIPGCREIARHEDTGLLVRPGDPRALADAIERLSADTDLRERLGLRARALVEEEFSDQLINQQVLSLYEQALAR